MPGVTRVGSEFSVNSSINGVNVTSWPYSESSVVATNDGGFLVVSIGYDANQNHYTLGQRYDATGTAIGSSFSILQQPGGQVALPSSTQALLLQNGNVVVLTDFNANEANEPTHRFVLTIVNAQGQVVASQIEHIARNQPLRTLESSQDSGFYVTWFDNFFGSTPTLNAQHYNSLAQVQGGLISTPVTLGAADSLISTANGLTAVYSGTYDSGVIDATAVAPHDSYRWYTISLSGFSPSATYHDISSASYTFSLGSQSDFSSARFEDAAVMDDGRLVLVWSAPDSVGSYDIFARVYNPDGSPEGAVFQVNANSAGWQFNASVAAAGNQFTISWGVAAVGGSATSTRAQVFSVDPSPATAGGNATFGAGADTVFGSVGADTVSLGGGNDFIHAQNGADTIFAGSGSDTIFGGSGDDLIQAFDLGDTLYGEAGDDTFALGDSFFGFVGSARTTIYGGANTSVGDSLNLNNGIAAVWVDLDYAGVQVWTRDDGNLSSGSWREVATVVNVENLSGTRFSDFIRGNSVANKYFYTGGFDDVDLRGGIDAVDFSSSSYAVWVDLTYGNYDAWTRGGTNLDSGTWSAIANLTNVENIVGSSFADALYGSAMTRALSGGAGDDSLYVRGVQRGVVATLDGGANDAGGDMLDFSSFGAAVWVHLAYVGNEAWTRDNSGVTTGAWRAIGDVSDIENLAGSAYNDDLAGDGGANRFYYTGGLDLIDGAGGLDTADFSRFSYAVWVDLAYAGVEAWTQDANQSYNGGPWRAIADLASIENLTGSSWNDVLRGDSNANLIQGGDGYDELEGRGGADTLHGGFGGFDTASYAHSTGPVTVNLTTNSASGGDAAGDSFISIEGITGSAFNDNLTGSSSGSVLDGGLGSDTLTGGAGADVYIVDNINDVIIEGMSGGPDRVETSLASYNMATTAANIEDFAHSNFVNYAVTGNSLDNTFSVYAAGLALSATFATIDGGANGGVGDTINLNDSSWGVWADLQYSNHQVWIREYGTGPWRAVADVTGIENMTDSGGNDYLAGDPNANRFNYTYGLDHYDGRGGADTADFSRSGDAVWVNLSYAGPEAWTRGASNLSSGTWRAIANLDNIENLTGSFHSDFLAGDSGVNILSGGLGADTLTGGLGADAFLFDLPPQYKAYSTVAPPGLLGSDNVDLITDFTQSEDQIQLSQWLFPALGTAGALGAGHLVAGAGAIAADADDFLLYNSTTGALFYDEDGNGSTAAIQFASLSVGLSLSASDFLIV